MNNKSLKIIIIVLTILTIGLTGYIIYDKITEKDLSNINDNINHQIDNNVEQEDKNNNENNDNNQLDNNNENKNEINNEDNLYKYVYGIYSLETEGEAYLFLWNNKTFKYTYDLKDKDKEGYLGTYEIKDNYLILNILFNMYEKVYNSDAREQIWSSAKIITETSNIKLKINSKLELYDENNKIKLNAQTAQSFGPNNDFYTNLNEFIDIPSNTNIDESIYNEVDSMYKNIDEKVKNIYGVYGPDYENRENGDGDLLLWPDKTFRYTYDLKDKDKEGYLGTYEIKDNHLILNNIFEIIYDKSSSDKIPKVITETSIIKLKMNQKKELFDENNKITLINYSAQTPGEGGNTFYKELKSLLVNHKAIDE